MSRLRASLDHPAVFPALLALPALPMLLAAGVADDPRALRHLVHGTGAWAGRFLVLALALGPLAMLRPRWPALRWLIRRRRAVGLAAFGYAAAHLAFHLADRGPGAFAARELARVAILCGWAAFLIMVPLALTSNDAAVRRLGTRWKPLQRWAYAAAALVFAHWALARHGAAAAVLTFAPLAALEAWRLRRNAARRRPAPA
jgi:sulfoxide reductase heme-binding subunit YedZ